MLEYFILVGVPATIALYNTRKKDEKLNKKVINAFFFIWLVLLLLRKETVGIDLRNYSYMFRSAINTSYSRIISFIFNFEHEFGFYFLSKMVSIFTKDFRALLTIISLVSVIPIWILYKDNVSRYPFLTIALFLNIGVFSVYFSCLRQILAMAFILPAYRATKEKRPFLFILIVFLAFLFHKSAVIMLLLYPAYHINLKRKGNLLAIVPVVALIYIFRRPFFTFFRSLISEFYSSDLRETGAIAILLLLVVFVVFSYLVPDDDKMSPEILGMRNILVLCAVLQIFAGVNPIAMRLNYYYLLFVPLVIPKIVECASAKNKTLAEISVIIMICFFTAYYFYDAYTDVSTLKIYPYVPFWA